MKLVEIDDDVERLARLIGADALRRYVCALFAASDKRYRLLERISASAKV